MFSYDNSDDCLPIAQMNSELHHAHLELLSAHCATHQLRLHYSSDDLARLGRRDVLRKSAEAASALNEFYSCIEKNLPQAAPNAGPELTSAQLAHAIRYVAYYLREQRSTTFQRLSRSATSTRPACGRIFRQMCSTGSASSSYTANAFPAPAFYAQARSLGFDNLPQVTHMDSLTFLDVLVFNQALAERSLFHALVHAVQFEVLGLERYTELFVQSFVKTKAHFTVPLEAHAFTLELKFKRPSSERFSVEDHVRRWVADGRY